MTKWGLMGVAIFLGLVFGVWDSFKETFLSPNPEVRANREATTEMDKLAKKCKEISSFAERFKCEKPVREWQEEQGRQRAAAKQARAESDEAKRKKQERDYEAYRESILDPRGDDAELIRLFRQPLAPRTAPHQSGRDFDSAITDFYRNPRRPQLVDSINQARMKEELRNVDVMPYENGANLILKYLGYVEEGAIKRAARELKISRALGQPEIIGNMNWGPNRPPLFPDVPKMSDHPPPEALNGKPPTSEEARKWLRREAKWELQRAITGIYRDCEEHFRPLYTQHLKSLLKYYIDSLASRTETPPQDKTYPLFLFSDEATPNERLGGALAILWQEQLTSVAEKLIVETPEKIFARGCPPDRSSFFLVGSDLMPELAGQPTFGRKTEELSKADMPQFVSYLETAYNHCRPSIRHFYVSYVRDIATRLAALQSRRPAERADSALLDRLRSSDRSVRYKALQETFASPTISDQIATQLPELAAGLFYDHCPSIRPEAQLASYREEKARQDADMAEFHKRMNEKATAKKAR